MKSGVIHVYVYRIKQVPGADLIITTEEDDIDEIRDGLINRYGDNFISVVKNETKRLPKKSPR